MIVQVNSWIPDQVGNDGFLGKGEVKTIDLFEKQPVDQPQMNHRTDNQDKQKNALFRLMVE